MILYGEKKKKKEKWGKVGGSFGYLATEFILLFTENMIIILVLTYMYICHIYFSYMGVFVDSVPPNPSQTENYHFCS